MKTDTSNEIEKPFGLACGYFSIHSKNNPPQDKDKINQECYNKLIELGRFPTITVNEDNLISGLECDKCYWYCCNKCINAGNIPNCAECKGPIQLEFDFT